MAVEDEDTKFLEVNKQREMEEEDAKWRKMAGEQNESDKERLWKLTHAPGVPPPRPKSPLIECRDCRRPISRDATKCPQCGADAPILSTGEHKAATMVGLIIFGIPLAILAAVFLRGCFEGIDRVMAPDQQQRGR